MGTITLPNNPGTIQNTQVTDATKVMENFTAIVAECNGSLDADNLAALAVETAKIANLAVTAAKLATDAVETLKIKDLNVTAGKLAADAVETAKIKDNNVTLPKLGLNAFIETLLDDENAAAACVTLNAFNKTVDDLDDISDGATYKKIPDVIDVAVEYESAVTDYYAVPLVGYCETANVYTNGSYVKIDEMAKKAVVPVTLPNGAVVTNFYSYAELSDGSIQVTLYRSQKTSTIELDMADHTHGSTGALNDNTILNATIDNEGFSYYVRILRGGANTDPAYINGVIITYTKTKP